MSQLHGQANLTLSFEKHFEVSRLSLPLAHRIELVLDLLVNSALDLEKSYKLFLSVLLLSKVI